MNLCWKCVQDLRRHVSIEDRVANRLPHYKCFQGSDVVGYLAEALSLSRGDAVSIGQRWMDGGVFYPVAGSDPFADSENRLYRFAADSVKTLLNVKSILVRRTERRKHSRKRRKRKRADQTQSKHSPNIDQTQIKHRARLHHT